MARADRLEILALEPVPKEQARCGCRVEAEDVCERLRGSRWGLNAVIDVLLPGIGGMSLLAVSSAERLRRALPWAASGANEFEELEAAMSVDPSSSSKWTCRPPSREASCDSLGSGRPGIVCDCPQPALLEQARQNRHRCRHLDSPSTLAHR